VRQHAVASGALRPAGRHGSLALVKDGVAPPEAPLWRRLAGAAALTMTLGTLMTALITWTVTR